MPAMDPCIGIIGGTGLGEALLEGLEPSHLETHELETPFGRSSGPIVTGDKNKVG